MNDNITWLFAPGTNAADAQMARYRKSIKVGNHTIKCDKHINIIGDNYQCVRFPEIDVEATKIPVFGFMVWGFMSFLMMLKGIRGDGFAYAVWLHRYNFGQDADVEAIQREYENISKSHEIICFGVSRGSAAMVNWLAKYQPTNIKGVILEGGPSSMDDLVKYSRGWRKTYYRLVRKVLPWISAFDPKGMMAYDSLDKIPNTIPFLIVTSAADKTVPCACSKSMYYKLRVQKQTNIEICILNDSGHDSYVSHNEKDAARYQLMTDFFYRTIGLDTKPFELK